MLCRYNDYPSTRPSHRLDLPCSVRRPQCPADSLLRRTIMQQPPHLRPTTVLQPTECGRHRPVPLPAISSSPSPQSASSANILAQQCSCSAAWIRLPTASCPVKLYGCTAVCVFVAAAGSDQPDSLSQSAGLSQCVPVTGTDQQSSTGLLCVYCVIFRAAIR